MLEYRLGRYRHFKGQEYELIGVARHSESLEPMAVYRALYGDGLLWVRPLEHFIGEVTRDGVTQKRFTFIEENKGE